MTFRESYRVAAIGEDGTVVCQHYLYSETLAQIQLGILTNEREYSYCKIVLYDPQGEVVIEREPQRN